MVLFGFKKRFAEDIRTGLKTQTGRKFTEKRWKELLNNRDLSLYTGLRTKYCELLGYSRITQVFLFLIQTNYFDHIYEQKDTWIKLDFDIYYQNEWDFDCFRILVDFDAVRHHFTNYEDLHWRDLQVQPVDRKITTEIVKFDGLTYPEFLNFFWSEHNIYEDFFIGIRWNYPIIPPVQEKSLLECFV